MLRQIISSLSSHVHAFSLNIAGQMSRGDEMGKAYQAGKSSAIDNERA